MTTISDLTNDLLMDIMSRLLVKHVIRCRCVSKPWRSLLTNNPTFTRLHLNQSILKPPNLLLQQALHRVPDPTKQFKTLAHPEFLNDDECLNLNLPLGDRVEVLGSCNGIFCLLEDMFFCLWNPSTGEYTEIGLDERIFNCDIHTFGFGFDSVTGEYKLVVIALESESSTRDVTVFSTGTNSWKRMEVGPPYSCIFDTNGMGVHVNGVVHWLSDASYFDSIISFNLKTEKFGEIPWLDDSDDSQDNFVLGILNEHLVIISYFMDSSSFSTERVDVWEMKGYGVKESWIRAFSIREGTFVDKSIALVFIWKTGELLLTRGSCDLVLYDPVPKTGRVPIVIGAFVSFRAYPYVEALTSIPALVAGNRFQKDSNPLQTRPKEIQ